MSEKPIIFSAPMVRAILEGRKTMTRRVLPWQPVTAKQMQEYPHLQVAYGNGGVGPMFTNDVVWPLAHGRTIISNRFIGKEAHPEWIAEHVKVKVGDRLWVRENWRQAYPKTAYSHGVVYMADRAKSLGMDEYSPRHKWKPSIYMPRWASRITLEVTDVKVERLQGISEADAMAEGVIFNSHMPADVHRHCIPMENGEVISGWNARDCFRQLWHCINGPGAWASNPWVAVYSFKRITP